VTRGEENTIMPEVDKIVQIIPTDGNYFIEARRLHRYPSNDYTTDRYRVVCWALIDRGYATLVIPLVAGERALTQMSVDVDWKIVREK
jgi:hypothetical protein